ncbi:MAG: BMP family ABC transporter substrate-binding protein [Clostridia bacterium]|nr:BMP family ABC transporter substrate-binding protein [Clostridia bacterium]
MKKVLSIVLAFALILSCVGILAGCGSNGNNQADADSGNKVSSDKIKFGIICLHDENSTYDKNFLDAVKSVQSELGLTDSQVIIKTNVDESDACYSAAVDLVEQGCNIVFANSFGHEDYVIQAAKDYPEVEFCHATGTKAHTEKLDNYHNAFASIYEGRFLAGVAAGMKIQEMIDSGKIKASEAKIGYVGAFPYAEVKSGYTSFFLGARYICKDVTMEVKYTNSWYDEALEKEAATTLINNGCVLISQHADSWGAPTACESAGIPNVSYNGSTIKACPNTFIVSSRINWAPYFKYIIKCVVSGEKISTDKCMTIADGAVELTDINTTVAAKGTEEKIAEVKAMLEKGELHVFDASTFTVEGKTLSSYKADVDSDANYTPDTEVISDGYFHESEYRSAPYFDLVIDGITVPAE